MTCSARAVLDLGRQYPWQCPGWAGTFHRGLSVPPAHPLNPMNPDNARILRITAAAGTELADPYSGGTFTRRQDAGVTPAQKRFTTHKAFLPHAAWLGQASAHCPIFPTAASRRSLVPVSVPMWGAVLSDPLPIVAPVGRYPAGWLMGRMPLRHHRNSPRPGMPRNGRTRY